jgi:D-alanyl-D-alanine carboxypeptidase
MMGTTNDRARRVQARPGAVRRDRRLRRPGGIRAPLVAMVLSSMALTAPGLAMAPPLQATEPTARPTRPVDLVPERRPPTVTTNVPLDGGIVVGQGAAPVAVDAQRYQAALDEARSRAKAAGVTFAVVRDGAVVWVGSSGFTRDGRPMAPDEPLVIGSVTKTFVAAAVLQLVAEGRVELDDPMRSHLPGLTTVSRRITVAHLLEHTSGLADVFNEATRVGLETDPGHAWTLDEILKTVRDPWYAPGDGWAYSNTNYLLLAMLLEEVTGESLADIVASRLTEPLGLESTVVLSGGADEILSPAWSTIFRGSGAMAAIAADLARWGDALYDGAVLPPAARARMLRTNEDDYGLGVQRIQIAGRVGYGHTGLLNTDTTLLLHVPSRDVTIALLVNRTQVDLDLMLRAHPEEGQPSLMELVAAR